MPIDGSTLEDYMKQERAAYYDLVIKLGFHGKMFKRPKNSVRVIIIPPSAEIQKFANYKSLNKSIDAIREYKDKWNNYVINFEPGPWFSKEGITQVEGLSGASIKYVIKRQTPMKYYSDKQTWGVDEMELIQHGYPGGSTETFKIRTINPVVLWSEARTVFCEIVSPSNAELKVPPIRVERPKREKREREIPKEDSKKKTTTGKKPSAPGTS
jgi:hypothetical protein